MEAARPATQADLEVVVALARLAREELAPTRGGELFLLREARPEPLEEDLREALEDPDQQVVVGTIDGQVLGYALVRLEHLRDGSVLAVLDDLVVEAEARGVGLGEALMDAVLGWCRARGCRGLDGIALPGNRATKNFFESFGMVARAILVHRDLRSDGTST